jgi:hypothetical protein
MALLKSLARDFTSAAANIIDKTAQDFNRRALLHITLFVFA